MEWDIALATALGAAVGGLAPFLASLVWKPIDRRWGRRVDLYESQIPETLRKLHRFISSGKVTDASLRELRHAVGRFIRSTAFCGREEDRVYRAVAIRLLSAIEIGKVRNDDGTATHTQKVIIVVRDLDRVVQNYYEWLGGKLARKSLNYRAFSYRRREGKEAERQVNDTLREAAIDYRQRDAHAFEVALQAALAEPPLRDCQ